MVAEGGLGGGLGETRSKEYSIRRENKNLRAASNTD